MRGLPQSFTAGDPVRVNARRGTPAQFGTFVAYGHSGYCSVQLPGESSPSMVHVADIDPAPAPGRFFSLTAEDSQP